MDYEHWPSNRPDKKCGIDARLTRPETPVDPRQKKADHNLPWLSAALIPIQTKRYGTIAALKTGLDESMASETVRDCSKQTRTSATKRRALLYSKVEVYP
jgi:hypothetical protein